MKKIRIENLYQYNYTANVLNVSKQKWSDKNSFNFIGNRKKQHLLCCFLGCSAVYTLKDGSKLVTPQNSIVYVPEESEYKITLTDHTPNEIHNCISINFNVHSSRRNNSVNQANRANL